jgi:hypothetical protein
MGWGGRVAAEISTTAKILIAAIARMAREWKFAGDMGMPYRVLGVDITGIKPMRE